MKELESLFRLRERTGDLLFLTRDLVADLRLFLFSNSLVGLPSTCSRDRIDWNFINSLGDLEV